MLKIENLHIAVDGKEIVKGLDLEIKAGEVHAIMGPNGAGKSTLAAALAGREDFEITKGKVTFRGKDITDMDPDGRAGLGLFLGFQYPVEIPGVSTMNFLKTALNALRRQRGEDELSAPEILKLVRQKAKDLDIDPDMLKRPLNKGFSGGEKKRNEMLQMAVLDPVLAVLDETDSGLDIDALKVVAATINAMRGDDRAFLLITHYKRLLTYIEPDYVHVLADGKIVKTGGPDLADRLEEEGYSAVA